MFLQVESLEDRLLLARDSPSPPDNIRMGASPLPTPVFATPDATTPTPFPAAVRAPGDVAIQLPAPVLVEPVAQACQISDLGEGRYRISSINANTDLSSHQRSGDFQAFSSSGEWLVAREWGTKKHLVFSQPTFPSDNASS